MKIVNTLPHLAAKEIRALIAKYVQQGLVTPQQVAEMARSMATEQEKEQANG